MYETFKEVNNKYFLKKLIDREKTKFYLIISADELWTDVILTINELLKQVGDYYLQRKLYCIIKFNIFQEINPQRVNLTVTNHYFTLKIFVIDWIKILISTYF